MLNFSLLWRAPIVNPVSKKAASIPGLNPVNIYGRVFFFSWFGFLIAFWSWYAFPPLLSEVIAKDLKLTQTQIANSNIIALVATLLVRLVTGPCCDRFGPRQTFAACLLAGAIPTFLAGTVTNARGLMALRFFVGILGGSFVPCQAWTTAFFDDGIVGTANALTAGFGNVGGGVTYFLMPAIYNSLVHHGLSGHIAWRVSFIVPGIMIVVTALGLLLLCPDCPTGRWPQRGVADTSNINSQGAIALSRHSSMHNGTGATNNSTKNSIHAHPSETKLIGITLSDPSAAPSRADTEAPLTPAETPRATELGPVQRVPSVLETAFVVLSPQTLVACACYLCSFGAELAVNSVLGAYYARNFPALSLQRRGAWAALFGLLNAVCRPLGGVFADAAYATTGSAWAKKVLLHSYGVATGVLLVVVGVVDAHHMPTMLGLVAALAFFLEGANGIDFAYVPHVHPMANGVVSGLAGASGNLGGIIFSIVFRYTLTVKGSPDYPRAFSTIGAITMAVNLAICWIRPLPGDKLGGR